jgi:predicted metalloprotease with PDZ domain
VHGTADLPLKALLERHGVGVHEDAAQPAQRLGLRVAETAGIQVKVVLRGGAAERAGFAAGDEWLAVAAEGDPGDGWRLHKLEDLALYAGPQRKLTALVARDKRLLRLPLELPEHATTWRLALRDATQLRTWLAAPH